MTTLSEKTDAPAETLNDLLSEIPIGEDEAASEWRACVAGKNLDARRFDRICKRLGLTLDNLRHDRMLLMQANSLQSDIDNADAEIDRLTARRIELEAQVKPLRAQLDPLVAGIENCIRGAQNKMQQNAGRKSRLAQMRANRRVFG